MEGFNLKPLFNYISLITITQFYVVMPTKKIKINRKYPYTNLKIDAEFLKNYTY